MSEEKLGLPSAVSIALGGMIGGGIYAVLGVVARITMGATWFAFIVAGIVALCSGYSYSKLNQVGDDRGGSVSFVENIAGNSTLAGMFGWTLLFGYIGSMAMYAFAFAEFALGFGGVPEAFSGVPLRPVVSIVAVAAFVGLNLVGARATGSAENLLVAVKMAVLAAFGVFGIIYATTLSPTNVTWGLSRLTSFGPVMAASISFVAFQGWQLLFYDQDSISDPLDTVPRAVYISIPVAVGIYVLVAAVTVNLAPQAIQNHPHVALADAASQMLSYFGLGGVGFAVISLSALFSTGSAINATLFSSGHFAKGMVSDGLLPDRIKKSKSDGVPTRTVLVIGGITAVFTAYGSLGGITSFASLAFIIVFGSMSYLAFRNRDHSKIHPLPPFVGTVGTALFFPLMFYNLYTREPNTFWTVIVVTVVVIAVEILYFEREKIEEGVIAVEEEIVAELENE